MASSILRSEAYGVRCVRLLAPLRVIGDRKIRILLLFAAVLFSSACGGGGSGSGSPVPGPDAVGLAKVRNVIVMMQENHSFDNYLGALPYMPSSPYHAGPCAPTDNTCVDGLTCTTDAGGALTCTNSNLD